MNTSYGLVLFSLLTLGSSAFAALPFEVKNLKGWTLQEIPDGDIAKQLTQGAAATLVRPEEATGLTVNINVHLTPENEAMKKAGVNVKAWHKAIFASDAAKIAFQNESVVKKDGAVRYIVEYQANTGTATPLNSILMVTILKGKTYTFIYEGERSVYLKNAEDVKKAFREMSVAPSGT